MMNTSISVKKIPIVDHIAPLAGTADAWLCDIWGVLHNGAAAYASAVTACQMYRRQGGTVLLLSNAPRPGDSVAEQLDKLGVPRDAWDAILTSGDATRGLVAALGATPVFHIGPDRDLTLFDGLPVSLVAEKQAAAVVCTGLYDDTTETPGDYMQMLRRLLKRDLEMICANPDIKVERGGRIIYCGGAVAQAYADLGGSVAYAGKPHAPIYDQACAKIADVRGGAVDKARILAIGDGVLTDIKGAAAAGIRSVFVPSRVHMAVNEPLNTATVRAVFQDYDFVPVAAMPALAW